MKVAEQNVFDGVTRLEVIGQTRLLVLHNVQVSVSIQDNGRTLKLFIKDRGENESDSAK